jgi:hypothetical protein
MQTGLVFISLFISMSNYDLLSKWRRALAEQKETTPVTIPLKPDAKPETSVYKDFISSIEKSAGLDPKEQEKKAKEQEKEDPNCKIKTACNCLDRSETSLEVSEIQEILNKYFASTGESIKLDVSGECDLETQKAIMRFQKNTGIECDGCVGDQTHSKMLELKLTAKAVTTYVPVPASSPTKEKDLTNTQPTSGEEYRSSASMSHVEEAKKEMKLFKNGKIKEWEEDAWPHIAKYWKHIGYTWAEKGTKNGFYGRAGKDNKWHWSAAFIQYCMRGNAEFKKLRWSGSKPGNHQYYWRAAKMNTKKLEAGNLRKGEWFYLSMAQAARIGYDPQVGDILFIGNAKPKHHGDIVISTTGGPATAGGYQKVGGNNSHSVMLQWRKNTGLITQNPAAYDLFRGISPGSQNSETKYSAVSKKEAGKYSYILGTIAGDIIESHNPNTEFYGASIQKPIAALAQLIQYKNDSARKLNDKEIGMLLSYSKSSEGSNRVNRRISPGNRSKSYERGEGATEVGKIDPAILRQILRVFDISNQKFTYGRSNNKQSALDYYKFLSGLERMTTGKPRNKAEEEFAEKYEPEMKQVIGALKKRRYAAHIKNGFRSAGITNFWGKGGRASGSLNYGIVIDGKYVLVIYTRFSEEKYGTPGYNKTGAGGTHTAKMFTIIKKLVNKIK